MRRLRNWLQPRLLLLIDRAAFDRAAKYDRYAAQMQVLGGDPDEGLRMALWMARFGLLGEWQGRRG